MSWQKTSWSAIQDGEERFTSSLTLADVQRLINWHEDDSVTALVAD